MTVGCSVALTTTMTVMMAPTSMELAVVLDQHDVVLRDTIRGVVGLITVTQQQPQSQRSFQAYANYVMCPSWVSFFFQNWSSPNLFILVSAFYFQVPMWLPCSPKGVHCFSSHPAAFEFQASLPPSNSILNPTNKKTNQSLSDFQTAIGAAPRATLYKEQHISHFRTTPVDTITFLQNSDEGVISASEVHKLLV